MKITQEISTHLDSWVVPTEEKKLKSHALVFYNVKAYEGKRIPLGQMREEASTYLAEHLMRPTRRDAYFDGEDWFHPDGTRYRVIFNEAILHTSDERVRNRFGSEEIGWDNAGTIAMNGTQPAFLLISHPGDVYRNPAFGAKSMTYLALPMGKGQFELAGATQNAYKYEVYSIPSPEISIDEHMRLARDLVINQDIWEDGLKLALELGPDYLIMNPFVVSGSIEAMNNLVEGMGYENFEEVKILASKMLEAENDPKAKRRRGELVDFFAHSLKDENESVWVSDIDRSIRMEAIADVMHYYFAMEAGAAYLGKDFEDIELQIKQDILDKVYEKTPRIFGDAKVIDHEYMEFSQREAVRMMMLRSNNGAYESYMVTGCVVNTTQFSQDFWHSGTSNFTNPMTNMYSAPTFAGLGQELETKETYSFDIRGICVGSCWDEEDENGNKIKHERNLGPCHLCEECDHKIQSQVE